MDVKIYKSAEELKADRVVSKKPTKNQKKAAEDLKLKFRYNG